MYQHKWPSVQQKEKTEHLRPQLAQRHNRGRALSLATVGRIGYVRDGFHQDRIQHWRQKSCDGRMKDGDLTLDRWAVVKVNIVRCDLRVRVFVGLVEEKTASKRR